MTIESIATDSKFNQCLFKNSISLKTIEDGNEMNPEPEEVFSLNKSWLFGLVKLNVITEDRKPGQDVNYKYKTLLFVKVAWVKYSFTFRTRNKPLVYKNGKDIGESS